MEGSSPDRTYSSHQKKPDKCSQQPWDKSCIYKSKYKTCAPVSYTHLTLPTICSV